MSKRRGMPKAEKRQRLQHIFFESESPFTLKELEKIGGKQGIVTQSIKEVLQELVDDNLVHLEKIGIANYYWSFPSEATATKHKIIKQLDESLSNKKRRLEDTKKEIETLSVGREKTDEYNKILQNYEKLQSDVDIVDKELDKLKENDPKVLDDLRAHIATAKAAINRWTDNIYAVKSGLKKKHGMSSKEADKILHINDDFDYIE